MFLLPSSTIYYMCIYIYAYACSCAAIDKHSSYSLLVSTYILCLLLHLTLMQVLSHIVLPTTTTTATAAATAAAATTTTITTTPTGTRSTSLLALLLSLRLCEECRICTLSESLGFQAKEGLVTTQTPGRI